FYSRYEDPTAEWCGVVTGLQQRGAEPAEFHERLDHRNYLSRLGCGLKGCSAHDGQARTGRHAAEVGLQGCRRRDVLETETMAPRKLSTVHPGPRTGDQEGQQA